ncbi:TLC domain-containing protein 3A-like [Artemia franciscana]|uniref:TLC domain-containing protein 3A-like n=1 Tax=Artemia franciscana TaxID=6661 RepID=UPI0032DB19E2
MMKPLPKFDHYGLGYPEQFLISMFGTFFYVVSFLSAGSCLMKYTKLSQCQSYKVSSLIVSSLQATMASVAALIVIFSCYDDILRHQHPLINLYTAFSMPYFAYDVWSMYYYYEQPGTFSHKLCGFLKTNGLMIAHHLFIASTGVLVILNWRHGIGDVIVAFFFFHEFSTPFVCVRNILSILKMKDTTTYSVNGILMILAFFICRIAVYPFMFYLYSRQENIEFAKVVGVLPNICTISSLLILLPQLYWFSLMIIGASKHFSNKNTVKRRQKLNNNKLD